MSSAGEPPCCGDEGAPKVTIELVETPSASDVEATLEGHVQGRKRRRRRKRQRRLCSSHNLVIALSVAALLLAAVALWPTMSAQSDSKQAVALAQWEAEKDFLEFCEQVSGEGLFFFSGHCLKLRVNVLM